MLNLRPYQQDAIDAVLQYWDQGGGNPLVDLATGLGKSVVIAKMTRDLLTDYPDMRVLQLVHVRELVMQNAQALLNLWPDAPLGIYSAGLGKRQANRPITFASIQSVFRLSEHTLGPIDLILVDEAHLVPKGGDGMYRTLINRLRAVRADMRVAGFTATPFRLDSGRLDQGEKRLFDKLVYSHGIRAGIEGGWLAPLYSKATVNQLDVSGVARRGGEFVAGALEAAVDLDPVTRAAVAEMAVLGESRKSWLVFCAGIKHARHVRDAIQNLGISCEMVIGDTPPDERARHIEAFKAGRLRALTNANVLTTGFDAPGVDLIAMLRPTLSPGLFVQMCGRGTRLSPGKYNCLILDFAGNVRRHGPVDIVDSDKKEKKTGPGVGVEDEDIDDKTDNTRECPECQHQVKPEDLVCESCGYEFEIKIKHDPIADAKTPILSDGRADDGVDQPVISWSARRHVKDGAPDSLCVTYLAGLQSFREWVMIERTGWLRRKAVYWWGQHGGQDPVPATVSEALVRFDDLTRPEVIVTRRNGRYHDIVGRKFHQQI